MSPNFHRGPLPAAIIAKFSALLFGLALVGCASIASIKQTSAPVPSLPGRAEDFVLAKKELSDAEKIEHKQPLLALGHDLVAA
ncbi:MAG: hypothetical protein JWP08_1979, partial [Bryobacterales bacterium]|nr:hypothetical protein [Bryobacterales bacterium]